MGISLLTFKIGTLRPRCRKTPSNPACTVTSSQHIRSVDFPSWHYQGTGLLSFFVPRHRHLNRTVDMEGYSERELIFVQDTVDVQYSWSDEGSTLSVSNASTARTNLPRYYNTRRAYINCSHSESVYLNGCVTELLLNHVLDCSLLRGSAICHLLRERVYLLRSVHWRNMNVGVLRLAMMKDWREIRQKYSVYKASVKSSPIPSSSNFWRKISIFSLYEIVVGSSCSLITKM